MNGLVVFVIAGLSISLVACSGGSSDFDDALLGEFAGVWDVRYNTLDDGCAILDGSVLGFVDVHTIEQSGNSISLQAPGAFGATLLGNTFMSGRVEGGNSFVAESFEAGIDFGDGFFCDALHRISYEATGPGSASTLFLRQLNCIEGISCETRAVGESLRR